MRIEPKLNAWLRSDIEIQNCKNRSIPISKSSNINKMAGHLENLQNSSAPECYVRLSQNLVGGIGVTWRFRIAKTILLRYPRWPN